jgi:hypothetical protein
MAPQQKKNWPAVAGSILMIYGICQACGNGYMTDYQRSQLQLQQNQQQLQAQQQQLDFIKGINDNSTRATSAMLENTAKSINSTPDYSGDQKQTNCVIGTDYMGRVVTQCNSQ